VLFVVKKRIYHQEHKVRTKNTKEEIIIFANFNCKKIMSRFLILSSALLILTSAAIDKPKHKPTVFIIGDSTVKNGSGKGEGGLWGWGDFLYQHVDTNKVSIRNYAIGGRSSRTFITEGRWDKVLAMLKKGDYVIMQFGHNDGGPVNDNSRARGTLKGTGEETEEIDNMLTGKHEIIHTYGWYMRKYIADTKDKGAIPIVCSQIPRNMWEKDKVIRNSADYAGWAKESAVAGKAFLIDLNEIIAAKYEVIGEEKVKTELFLTDHTHTTEAGAIINASAVAEGIKSLKGCRLSKYLK
jgi:rhamnogalacturonan acetylesterase